ncbi:MAG: hypothetical protein LBV00_11115 [Propionibacteriaceae bacterium]|jgi:predicted  nucleic acid-binding Zn-ribbon protein|nr:hypothetical protein [Propionibacteriaceae bacterium]
MKTDPANLMTLLELQSLDTALDQVKHKAKSLPVHGVIADLMRRHGSVKDDLVAAQTERSDAAAAARRAEADVVPVRERLTRNQARVDSGEMTAKALSSAIDEIEHLKQRVSDLEDAQLEAMEALDLATAHVGQMSEQVEEIEQEVREQLASRDAAVAELSAKANDLSSARTAKASQVPQPLLALYDKIRARNNGVAVAKFDGRRCQGCGLEATVADINRYLSAPSDEVIRCAECDRILVR